MQKHLKHQPTNAKTHVLAPVQQTDRQIYLDKSELILYTEKNLYRFVNSKDLGLLILEYEARYFIDIFL